MKRLFIKKAVLVCMLLSAFSFVEAHDQAPTFSVDTVDFSFRINNKVVDKTKINDILTILDHGFRKVEKANKTLYIFDESGFVVEESKEGISIMLFYSRGEKETDPRSVFTGKLVINGVEINAGSPIALIADQLPKTEKTLAQKDLLLYVGKKFVMSGESKNGSLKQLDFGFRNK